MGRAEGRRYRLKPSCRQFPEGRELAVTCRGPGRDQEDGAGGSMTGEGGSIDAGTVVIEGVWTWIVGVRGGSEVVVILEGSAAC